MNSLVEQAAELQHFLDEKGWRSCIIGGLAVLRWGEPRYTQDVDVSLFTGFGDEETFARVLVERFMPRISDPIEFAVANRVLLLRGDSGIPLDIALSGFPFEEEVIARASSHEYLPGIYLRTASAEDLIVLKAFANRDRDWVDVSGIVVRQRSLHWDSIWTRLGPLAELKGQPEILRRLEDARSAAQ